METWKEVNGYKGVYEVSNLGNVRSKDHLVIHSDGKNRIQKGRILKSQNCHKGYLRVSLSRNGKKFTTGAHRLVAQAFIPNPENKEQVNHKNGIKTDNRAENLEWCTNSENQIHAVKNSLVTPNYGEKHHMAKLTNKQVVLIRKRMSSGTSLSTLSNEYKISAAALSKIKQNKTYVNTNN